MPPSPSTSASTAVPRTVLVLDDFSSVRNYHMHLLGKCGYRCEGARDGQEALQKLQDKPVDLVMLDITMPNLNGLEFIRQIRDNPAYAKLPVLVISIEPVGNEVRCASTAGAGPVGFAQKPLLPQALIREVERLLAGR